MLVACVAPVIASPLTLDNALDAGNGISGMTFAAFVGLCLVLLVVAVIYLFSQLLKVQKESATMHERLAQALNNQQHVFGRVIDAVRDCPGNHAGRRREDHLANAEREMSIPRGEGGGH